jgi:integrase
LADTRYLKRRHSKWSVIVAIPRHLQKAAGKREFVRALGTSDLEEANRRKHQVVAEFKRLITAMERQEPIGVHPLEARALQYAQGEVVFYQGGEPSKDLLIDSAAEEAEEAEDSHGKEAAVRFFKGATGQRSLLHSALVDTWLSEIQAAEQTKAQHRMTVKAFMRWAGGLVLIEDVDRKMAGSFVSHLLSDKSPLTPKTVKRYASSLSSLWRWLEARGYAEVNPWLGHGIARRGRGGEASDRKRWKDIDLVKLLSSDFTPRWTAILHDLVRLALVTGARLDELCSLELRDVQKLNDGWWIDIRQGKTEAAKREVPVHRRATHVLVKRRKGRQTGFLFEGLNPGGPDRKRSASASKAFGRFTKSKQLGLEATDRQVFHALRNTFTEAMEAAEVAESTTKLIIGHKRASLTYGHYSRGDRVNLRKAINKLHYSPALWKLIEGKASKAGGRKGVKMHKAQRA